MKRSLFAPELMTIRGLWVALCHFHGLPDGIDEGFRGEWLHDAGGPDNGNASFDTEAGIEGAFGYFFSTGDGDGNENRIGLFGNMEAFKP